MRVINICGKRGLGDLISGTSYALQHVPYDSIHIIFNYPPGFHYRKTISTLMDEFVTEKRLTYYVNLNWFSINESVATERFGKKSKDADWFFTITTSHPYLPFKSQWKKNLNGPVGLCLNNENTNSGYPFKGKWFSEVVNKKLLSMIDEKNYILLGRPKSVRENIDIISECRYVIGVDGAWAHTTHCMNAPFKLTINSYDQSFYRFHKYHPNIKFLKEKDTVSFIENN